MMQNNTKAPQLTAALGSCSWRTSSRQSDAACCWRTPQTAAWSTAPWLASSTSDARTGIATRTGPHWLQSLATLLPWQPVAKTHNASTSTTTTKLKGDWAEDTSWPEKVANVQIFWFACFTVSLFHQQSYKRRTGLLPCLSSSVCSHVGSLFANAEPKKAGSPMYLTLFITDTGCWAQNGSSHGHLFKTSKLNF